MTAGAFQDFVTLTHRGKLRRLYRLAEVALSHYDLPATEVRLHTFATNAIYRVRTAAGAVYALRLAYPGWRTLSDLRAEATWLEALARETNILAPRVVPARDGSAVLSLQAPWVSGQWPGTLMTWLPGRLLAHYLTPDNLARLGALFARLHQHGKDWQPPPGFTTRRFEAFLSRDEPDVLFSEAVLDTFTVEERRAFLQARSWVDQEYAALDRRDLRVIHCDLWHENVKIYHSELYPFDFEDTIWGFRLHDIAMSLLDLLETVGPVRYPELQVAFRSGYERYLHWPDGRLAVLQIGRLLWQVNHVARFEPASLDTLVANHSRIFREYAHRGELIL